ncbi:exonuclease 3'-5' domain-containing protein 2 [Hydra vulgaris]|uniref:Exonuclease 3'-5' domain-containing protein 2 n=1 Tax=Hydra vulgaris TaxID=6087 RepID=A0ABM4DIC4_HYDVU
MNVLFEDTFNLFFKCDATFAFISLTIAITLYKVFSKFKSFKASKKDNLICLNEVVKFPFSVYDENTKIVTTNESDDIPSLIKTVFQNVIIYVLNKAEDCNVVLECFQENLHFVGLDCEWVSNEKNYVALIQLSLGTTCLIYRIPQSTTNEEFPFQLKKLLENQKILKFGVAIYEDVRRLHSHGVTVRGFVDLRILAQRCLPVITTKNPEDENKYKGMGLQSLSYKLLNMNLDKSRNIQCSNWHETDLSKEQILYAAKDAIASLEVFYALVISRKYLQVNFDSNSLFFISTLKSNIYIKGDVYKYCHNEDKLINEFNIQYNLTQPSAFLVEMACSMCQGIVGLNFKQKNVKLNSKVSKTVVMKEKVFKHPCREKPLYENCYLLAPDGKILATINQNKAKWYLQKGLGFIDCEEPFTVRLLFQPHYGTSSDDGEYYTTVKQNVCVVCGRSENLVRKMVVPHDYRKHFPVELKGHTSHDVLLLCLHCHRTAQHADDALRQELATKHLAPLGTKERMILIDNPVLLKIRSAAKALFNQKSKIPYLRKIELETIIKDYYGVETISENLLRDALNMNVKITNESFQYLHGEKVVKDIIREDRLFNFIRMWRQHFLDVMQPKYMPELWSVDHNIQKYDNLKKAV